MFPSGEPPHLNPKAKSILTETASVRGVDLFPPPVTWMPPNCILEVDNILEPWTWNEEQDLIHIRIMIGSFDPSEWETVYTQCYK